MAKNKRNLIDQNIGADQSGANIFMVPNVKKKSEPPAEESGVGEELPTAKEETAPVADPAPKPANPAAEKPAPVPKKRGARKKSKPAQPDKKEVLYVSPAHHKAIKMLAIMNDMKLKEYTEWLIEREKKAAGLKF